MKVSSSITSKTTQSRNDIGSPMRIRRRVLALWIVSLATSVAFAQSSAVPTKAPDSSLPVEIVVPVAPIAVRGAGASHLFYELHLTNFRATPLEMTNLEVHAGDNDGRLLEGYSGQEISDRLVRPGAPRDLPDKRVLGAGLRAIVMLHLRFEGTRPVPSRIWHRVTFADSSVDTRPMIVAAQRPLVIDPPLRGGDWLAANGPSNDSVHRRTLLLINGEPHIAQRFAIDWIKLGPGGRPAHDDRSRNENWNGYGEDVLAVADGTVIATKDAFQITCP